MASEENFEFAKLTGDTKASLALLVENGLCKVSASASLVVLPSMHDKSYEQGGSKFEALPASARDVYFGDKKKKSRSGSNTNNTSKDQSTNEFLDDNWYFVELHQSILQESTQKSGSS